jgi:hypothetical protein
MEMQTVNVVEYVNDSVLSVHAFSDDEVGNKEAEEVFIRCAKENGADQKDLDDFALEDGFYEGGEYQVFLTHSYL